MTEIEKAIARAVTAAVHAIGLERLKKCSFFLSNERRKLRASTVRLDIGKEAMELVSWRVYCIDPVLTPMGLVERGPVKIYERWVRS